MIPSVTLQHGIFWTKGTGQRTKSMDVHVIRSWRLDMTLVTKVLT